MKRMFSTVISLLFAFSLSTVAFATEAPKLTSPKEWSAPTSANEPKRDSGKYDVKKEKKEKKEKKKEEKKEENK